MTEELRRAIESGGDRLADLHVWRLGPGHLGAIVSILTAEPRDAEFYRSRLSRFRMLSHVTIEVRRVIASGKANKTILRPPDERRAAPDFPKILLCTRKLAHD